MISQEIKESLVDLVRSYEGVKLFYLFGSQARDNAGPMSDYDFAIYSDTGVGNDVFLVPELQAKISKLLGTDKVDLCDLSKIEMPELMFDVINGKLLYEVEPYKELIEPQILNKYFDFKLELRKNNLTKS